MDVGHIVPETPCDEVVMDVSHIVPETPCDARTRFLISSLILTYARQTSQDLW